MSGKQIVGIILLLAGLGLLYTGATNTFDLIGLENNKMVEAMLQVQGTSLQAQWIKYGSATVIGIIMTIAGILLAKKQIVNNKDVS